jgi:hypothetical protein
MVEVPNCHLVQPVSRWQPIAAATMVVVLSIT